jgi:hypothetical protein
VINESSPAHSGSRWEPHLNFEVEVAARATSGDSDRRRNRQPLLVFLISIAVLGTGASGVAVAEAMYRADREPASQESAAPGAPSSREGSTERHGEGHRDQLGGSRNGGDVDGDGGQLSELAS